MHLERVFYFMFYLFVKVSLHSTKMTHNIAKLVNQDSKNWLPHWLYTIRRGQWFLTYLTERFLDKRGKNSSP